MTKTAAQSEKTNAITPGLRRFLYVTAALTGAAILIVEILGAKMLSPYVGTSHFVWTAQITVTLISLALGYYLGGIMVDRSPKLDRLFFCILLAALYLAVSVLVVKQVAYAFLKHNLALGALMASATLFFVPLTLLAAVGPFLIRILALSFTAIGSQVGRLSAMSTLGSVLGTLLIGYVLIPFLANSVTMYLTSGILCLSSGMYFAIWGKRNIGGAAVVALIALGIGFVGVRHDLQPHWTRAKELYRGNSNFGMLQVIQLNNTTRRYYLNDFLVQNTYDTQSRKSTSLFTYMLRYLTQAYTTNLQSALCIGMGVGIVPAEFARSGMKVDVVEINPAVVPVARDFFDFEPDKCQITFGDGRYVINRSQSKYDAVVLDAFLGDSSPSHLMTREAFENIRRILNPNGVLVINCFGDTAAGKDFFAASLAKTLGTVFTSVRAHTTGNGNLFFAASANPNLQLRAISTADAHPEVASQVSMCMGSVVKIDTSDGVILTDDFNPIDFYDAHNRELHRRLLAFSISEL